jgi:septum formation protein
LHPEELLLRHSIEKARDVAKYFQFQACNSAATSVLFNGKLLGKPQYPEKAEEMLKMLSRKKFSVITGLTVLDLDNGIEISELEFTTAWMDEMNT